MRSNPQDILARKVLLARLAIFIERTWVAIWPATMIAGLALLAILTGLAGWLPVSIKLVAAVLFAAAFLIALKPVLSLRRPDRTTALRRIEKRTGLKHRPATTFEDRLAGDNPSPQARAIWQAHRQKVIKQLRGLKSGTPRSGVPARDPFALRNALAVALIGALFLSAGDWRSKVAEAVSTTRSVPASLATLDAWITPPPYTGKAPVLLTSEAAKRKVSEGGEFLVPQGSKLVIRLNGAAKPGLKLLPRVTDTDQPVSNIPETVIAPTADGKFHEHRMKLDHATTVVLNDTGNELARWPVAIIPDNPPEVEIAGAIVPTATAAFAVPWKASDDYGVAGVRAEFKLVDKKAEGNGRKQRRLTYDAPAFPVNLQKLNPKTASGRAFQDLTEHPWSGLDVELKLTATDQAGQKTASPPLVFTLPERRFRKMLARALVEQRRNIVNNPDGKHNVVRALASLMAWPSGLIETSGIYLSMRDVTGDLYRARTDEDLKGVVKELWQLAVLIEDGDLSDALKELNALKKELQKALAENAPPEKISELMNKLRAAMDRYLEAMMRQMQKAMRNGDQMQKVQPGQAMRSQDLKKMLDQIENLARSGARDAAQEMLSQLESLMRNLRAGVAQQRQPQRNSPMGRMLEQLSEMMKRQRDLMDRTQRQEQRRYGENFLNQLNPQNGQRQRGQGQRQGGQQQGGQQLSQDQSALGKMLEDMLKQLERQGMNAPKGLGQSRRSMQGAAEALREGQRGRALGRQGEALEGLRQGARQMAQNMRQQGTGNEGNYGRHGEARGDQRDPLGRPMPRTGEDRGPEENMLPTESAIQRAREILDLLRNRSNNPERPRLELDYFDRLLRGLY